MSLSIIKVNNSTLIGVDNEPTVESDNLVKSGGVAKIKNYIPIQLTNKLEFTIGAYYRWDNQRYVTTDGNKLTDFIEVEEGWQILVNISPDDDVTNTITAFDANYNVVWEQCVHGNLVNYTYIVPSGIKYLRFGTRSGDTYLQSARIKFVKAYYEIISSLNIANPASIFDGYVSSNGYLTTGASYTNAKCIKIPVIAGETISFGNYFLDNSDTAYYSFHNANGQVVSSGGLPTNTMVKLENKTVPSGAVYLYFTLRQNPSTQPSSAYAEVMCNYGDSLISYAPYAECINKINGIELNVPKLQEEVQDLKENTEVASHLSDVDGKLYYNGQPIATGSSLSSVVTDLPVSDGTGIQSGYAYINSIDRSIKVKE